MQNKERKRGSGTEKENNKLKMLPIDEEKGTKTTCLKQY